MQRVKVTPDYGDEYVVEVSTRDVLKWEREDKSNSAIQLAQGTSISTLYKLTYFAAKRTKVFDGTLDEFQNTVDIEGLPEEDDNPPIR